jgi:Phage derived protein Gp49-like (DUF891)
MVFPRFSTAMRIISTPDHPPDAVYVLHVFQKKSKRGKATPQQDIELVETRLRRVAEMHAKTEKDRESGR